MSAARASQPSEGQATVDVDGCDVVVSGQPRLTDLPRATQLLVQGSVVADLALRTAVASALSAGLASWGVRSDFDAELAKLPFYRELASARDATTSFPAPRHGVVVDAQPSRHQSSAAPDGVIDSLRFDSPFEALNPLMRDCYDRFGRNRVACAQHWRHNDGPRDTLCVIHGFMASAHAFNSAFFSLQSLFRAGYDVLLYVLPFHGPRRSWFAPYDGWDYFAHGVAHINETVAHSIHDFRLFVDYLQEQGSGGIGVTGVSLGGYTAALLASVEPRLQLAVTNAAVTDMGSLMDAWLPANLLIAAFRQLAGMDRVALDDTLSFHSPLTYAPLLDREHLMIIGGLGDRLAPPQQTSWLWEHWGEPRLHWYPGNHAMHFNRGSYQAEMLAFMRGAGFAGSIG